VRNSNNMIIVLNISLILKNYLRLSMYTQLYWLCI